MGTGFAVLGSTASFADLVELPHAGIPPMTFTWAHDVVPYLPPSGAALARERQRARQDARRAAVHGAWPQWNAHGTWPCHAAHGMTGPFGPRSCRNDLTTGRHRAGTPEQEE